MKLVAVCLAMALLSTLGTAAKQPTKPLVTIYGQGAQSCGLWAERNRNSRDSVTQAWVLGYVSGVVHQSGKKLKNTDAAAMSVWMDNYCKAHPLELIVTGASELVDTLEIIK